MSAKAVSNDNGHTSHGNDEHHIIPLATYFKIFGSLIVLTGLTVLAAQFDFGAFNTIVAFGIASVKATLVLGYFMHLKYDNLMNRVIIGSGVFFLIVLWFFSILDIGTRLIPESPL
jgi:cytochrome c oxidase subunit IV